MLMQQVREVITVNQGMTDKSTLTRPGCTHTGGSILHTKYNSHTPRVHAYRGIYSGCKHTTYNSDTPRHTWASKCTRTK